MDSVLLETPADATATEKRHDDHQRIDHFARVASERGIKIDVDPDGTVHYNSEAGVQKRKKHRSPSERARSARRGHEHAYRRLHGHDPPDDRDSIDENVNQEGDRIVLEVSAVDAAQDAAASVAASMVASAVAVQVAQVKEAAIVQEARAAADEVAEEAAADEVAAEEAAAEEAAASFDEEEQCYFDLSMSAMDAARDAAASVAAAAATLEMATRTPHAPVRNAPPTPKLNPSAAEFIPSPSPSEPEPFEPDPPAAALISASSAPPAYVGADDALARMRDATAQHGIMLGPSSPTALPRPSVELVPPATLNPAAPALVYTNEASWSDVITSAPAAAAVALEGVPMSTAPRAPRTAPLPNRGHPYYLRELVRQSRARSDAFRRSRQEAAAGRQPAASKPIATAIAEAAVAAAAARASNGLNISSSIRQQWPPPVPVAPESPPYWARTLHGPSIRKTCWPRPPPWTPLARTPFAHSQTRRRRPGSAQPIYALLARVRRSDSVHLKKGDETWFCELLDKGLVPPGMYGKYGHIEMNRPYYDAAVAAYDLRPMTERTDYDLRTGLSRNRPRPPPALAPFIPSARFKGPRDGYVFRAGPAVPPVRPGHPSFVPEGAGLGYYLELD